MIQAISPYQQFFDTSGSPLNAGYIYIGEPSLNPETSPITVYWDEAGTLPAAQPIRTVNGYPSYNGSPARIYTNALDYSMTVKNNKLALVSYTDSITSYFGGIGLQVVNTYATLRTITPSATRSIYVSYGETVGDGAQGNFYAVTGAAPGTYVDNGGTIIVPTGGDGSSAWLRIADYIIADEFNPATDGVTETTTELQAAINAANAASKPLIIIGRTYVVGSIAIPSNMTIICLGDVTLKAKASLNNYVLKNASGVAGDANINIFGKLIIDGNYTNQTSGSGALLDTVTNSYIEHIELKNCYGHGLLFSSCSKNIVGYAKAVTNGKLGAGYGVYLYNSSQNRILESYTEDNCIGIAIEASGASALANKNYIGPTEAVSNRADFSQSGAGVHIEASVGGNADDNTIVNPYCRNSTGTGLTISTASNIRIIDPVIKGNSRSGITTLQSTNFNIIGGEVTGNASGEPPGYEAQLRFDDSGLSGSTGTIIGLRASGTIYGAKTFSTGCAVQFANCAITGTTSNYVLTGTLDGVSGLDANGYDIRPRQPSFRAGKSASVAVAGVLVFDSVNHDTRGSYNNTTGVFTAPVAGVYHFDAYATDGAAARIAIFLRVNSTNIINGTGVGGVTAESEAQISTTISLNAGDLVDIYLATGTTATGTLYTQFSGYLIG